MKKKETKEQNVPQVDEIKKAQPKLPGMPQPGPVEIAGEKCLADWEEVKVKEGNFKISRDALLKEMEQCHTPKIVLEDSTGTKMEICLNPGKASITIKKAPMD